MNFFNGRETKKTHTAPSTSTSFSRKHCTAPGRYVVVGCPGSAGPAMAISHGSVQHRNMFGVSQDRISMEIVVNDPSS